VEPHIAEVFRNIRRLGEQFDEYRVIVAYDHSADKTLRCLVDEKRRFAECGIDMIIIINDEKRSMVRTENIGRARNSLIDKMNELRAAEGSEDWSYFAMIDLDNVSIGDVEPIILSKVLERNDWDAISFNRDDYYDIWALSFGPFLFNCWSWSTGRAAVIRMYQEITNVLKGMGENDLLSCYSAFNGFALYRCTAFLNCRYQWTTRTFSKEIMEQNARALGAQPVNRPDDCEHRYFHLDAITKNGARIRISPMKLFTSHVKLFH